MFNIKEKKIRDSKKKFFDSFSFLYLNLSLKCLFINCDLIQYKDTFA